MLGLSDGVAIHQQLRDELIRAFPDIDEETLQDTLEGISDLPQMLAAVVRSQLDDWDLVNALRSRMADLQQRLGRIEGRAEKKRALVAAMMEKAEIRKLAEPDFTASLRATPPALVVFHEEEIPETYWKPQPPKLDRSGLLMTLRAGTVVPGAGLSNGSVTLSVRTR